MLKGKIQNIILIVCLLFCLLSVINIKSTETFISQYEWWNNDWLYRKRITISNTSTDYSMKIIVYKPDGYDNPSNGTIDCEGRCNNSFFDIRFIENNNLLPIWIENKDNETSATIWFKTNGSNTIYMYYGNNNATDISNASAVFIFFNGEEDGSVADWIEESGSNVKYVDSLFEYSGSYCFRIQQYHAGGGTPASIRYNVPDFDLNDHDYAFECRLRPADWADGWMHVYYYHNDTVRLSAYPSLWKGSEEGGCGNTGDFRFNATYCSQNYRLIDNYDEWHHLIWTYNITSEISNCWLYNASDGLVWNKSDMSISAPANTTMTNLRIRTSAWCQSPTHYNEIYLDNIIIRKYIVPEPTWSTFGNEDSFPPWDIVVDGVIDYLDVSSLVSHYGESGPPDWIRDDINDDGIVNYLDASILVSHYGESY